MTTHTKGLLLTLLGVILMSFESLFIKLSDSNAITFALYFGVFLSIFSLSMIFLKEVDGARVSLLNKGAFIAGICMCISNLCFISAVVHVGIANSVLILASIPIFSALFALLLLKEKTPKRVFVASFFVFIGIYIIILSELTSGGILGNLLALCCSIFTALTYVVLKIYHSASRWAFIAYGGFFIAFFCSFFADFNISQNALLCVIALGVFITPISRVLIANGAKYIIPAQVGLLIVVESILAPIWGWIFLDQMPPPNTFIGGAIIVISVGVNSFLQLKQSQT